MDDEELTNFEIPYWESRFFGLSGRWPADHSGLAGIETLILIKNHCLTDDYNTWDDWYNKNHREGTYQEFLEVYQEQFELEKLLKGGYFALSAGFMALFTLIAESF